MKLISFALTTDAFLEGQKTVTRRLGWKGLRAGERLMAVEKAMGLRRGERVRRLGEIEVLSVRRERLDAINEEDVRREGFPGMRAGTFVQRYCAWHACARGVLVTRIEFRRVTS